MHEPWGGTHFSARLFLVDWLKKNKNKNFVFALTNRGKQI